MAQWSCLKTFVPSPDMWSCLTWVKPDQIEQMNEESKQAKVNMWDKMKLQQNYGYGMKNLHRNCMSSPTLKRDSLRNSYNERARQGFKYWPMDRPKPTSFGRYGIGTYKTVLGLGSAPRT